MHLRFEQRLDLRGRVVARRQRRFHHQPRVAAGSPRARSPAARCRRRAPATAKPSRKMPSSTRLNFQISFKGAFERRRSTAGDRWQQPLREGERTGDGSALRWRRLGRGTGLGTGVAAAGAGLVAAGEGALVWAPSRRPWLPRATPERPRALSARRGRRRDRRARLTAETSPDAARDRNPDTRRCSLRRPCGTRDRPGGRPAGVRTSDDTGPASHGSASASVISRSTVKRRPLTLVSSARAHQPVGQVARHRGNELHRSALLRGERLVTLARPVFAGLGLVRRAVAAGARRFGQPRAARLDEQLERLGIAVASRSSHRSL